MNSGLLSRDIHRRCSQTRYTIPSFIRVLKGEYSVSFRRKYRDFYYKSADASSQQKFISLGFRYLSRIHRPDTWGRLVGGLRIASEWHSWVNRPLEVAQIQLNAKFGLFSEFGARPFPPFPNSPLNTNCLQPPRVARKRSAEYAHLRKITWDPVIELRR